MTFPHASMVLADGHVLTCDTDCRTAEAVAIRNATILAVGSAREIASCISLHHKQRLHYRGGPFEGVYRAGEACRPRHTRSSLGGA